MDDTGASETQGETLWQLAVEHSPVGMAVLSAQGRLITANRSLCAMVGYSEAQLRTMPFTQFTHPDDVASDLALFEQTLRGEISHYRLTKRYLHADGSIVWGDLSVVLMRDKDGAPLQLVSQVIDVTAQIQSRSRLAVATAHIERERRLAQAILDTVDVGLALIDSSGRYERTNRRHRDFLALAYPDGHLGWAGQEGAVFAADGHTRLGIDDMPSVRALREERFDDYRIWVGEDPVTRRALSVSARRVVEDDGTVGEAALAYNDVTDLMRAVSARDDFVAAVSHELRTPLASVRNHLELLLDGRDELDQHTLRSLEVMHRNSLRLQRLVSDLLSSAQERAGGLKLVRSDTDVAALVREAVEAAEPAARQRDIGLVAHAPACVRARLDAQRVRQVLDNLVFNAVTYTGAGGQVEVFVSRDADAVVIEVRDTGIGVAPEDLDRLFQPFFRSAAARRRSSAGLGLGLAVVHAIVEAHGGRHRVSSTLGRGTSVEVRLPSATKPGSRRHR